MRNEVVGTDDQRRRRQLAALVGMMAVIVLLVFALTVSKWGFRLFLYAR